jgi:YjjG family noncanonical pyrimidine nucleotidase
MHYTNLLLDLDHTLFDSDTSETTAFVRAMDAAGINMPEQHFNAYRKINVELWAAVERGEISPHGVRTRRFELLVAEQRLDADPEHLANDFVAGLGEYGELYEGAFEVVDQLSSQASLALVTNGLGEVQRARVERLGIGDFFDAIVISAEVGAAKPGTEIFDLVFEALDSPGKDSALMVGDSLSSDMQGGTNFGIATCWYNPKRQVLRRDDLVSHEIQDLRELLGFVAV